MFEFGIKDAIDILLVALMLFYIYRLMRDSRSLNVFSGILIFIVVWLLVSQILEMRLLGSIMDKLVSVGVIALIVLFQDEIRKFFISGEDDEIIFAQQVNDEGEILVMTDKGYAKRSFVFDYELQGRNGKGVKTFDFKKNGSNGTVIAFAMYIKESIDITVEQVHGTKTVISSEEIMIEQRAGKGRMTIMTILDDVVVKGYPVK